MAFEAGDALAGDRRALRGDSRRLTCEKRWESWERQSSPTMSLYTVMMFDSKGIRVRERLMTCILHKGQLLVTFKLFSMHSVE